MHFPICTLVCVLTKRLTTTLYTLTLYLVKAYYNEVNEVLV